MAIYKQLREAAAEPSVYVADNGIYSEANMRQLNAVGITWISRVSETSIRRKRCYKKAVRTGSVPKMAASSGIVGS